MLLLQQSSSVINAEFYPRYGKSIRQYVNHRICIVDDDDGDSHNNNNEHANNSNNNMCNGTRASAVYTWLGNLNSEHISMRALHAR